MAGAYSRDLRSRVLAAVEAGETLEAAARWFAVARSTVYRWKAAMRVKGRREAKPMGHGPAPVIGSAAEAAMLELAGSPHHLGLAEIAARLAETHGVRVHLTTVHRALRRAGLDMINGKCPPPMRPMLPGGGSWRLAFSGRFSFLPLQGGRLELPGVLGGVPSLASSSATRAVSA